MLYRGIEDGTWQVAGGAYGAHIGYAYYFIPHFGIGIGADIHRYGGGIRRTYSETQYGVYDTDGEICDITTTYTNWTDRQALYYIELPLSINIRIPVEPIEILINIGAKYNLSIGGRQWAEGQVSYVGYYDKWHLTLENIAPHDFYTTRDGEEATALRAGHSAALFGRIDVAIPIDKHWSVIAGVYGQYMLQNIAGSEASKESWKVLERTDGTAHPMAAGVELGVRYMIKHKKHNRCKCL